MPVRKERTQFKYNPDFAQQFRDSAKETAGRFLRVEADRLSAEMRNVILEQRYHWYPLSPEYLRRKIAEGFDPRILIRTKQYVESIQVFGPDETPDGILFRVDVPNGEHNSGLPFRELARIMEFGRRDGKKPYARPHWRPTWGIFVRDLPTVTGRFKSEILNDFRLRNNG